MSEFKLNIPTKICFGREITREVIIKESEIFAGNVLIVSTGRSLIRLGYLDELINWLKELKTIENIYVYDKVSQNPRLDEINEAAVQYSNANVIVGFGGGSALDAAKAVAATIGMSTDANRLFYDSVAPDERTLPIVAIPTTAGTGSELSKAAIVSDSAASKKGGIRGENLYPKLAIVDSKYTESVPDRIAMETGFDVLAHAMESYVSRASSLFTRMLSREAIDIVGRYLPATHRTPNDYEAREKLCYASMIMGINLGNASTALPHRMQYPIGAHTDTSHGAGLAAIYRSWIKYEYEANPEETADMIQVLTGVTVDTSETAQNAMSEFMGSIGLTYSLKDLGVQAEQIEMYVSEITGNLKNDPVAEMADVVKKIYMESL